MAILCYALLALIIIPVFPHFVSPNEFSRWAVAAAVVEDGTIEVTRFAPLLGGRFEDLSEVGGRLYSNKAPGALILAIPAYAVGRLIFGPASPATMRSSLTLMRWPVATLPVIALALLLWRVGSSFRRPEATRATAITALLFGTPVFAYGLLCFSHALAALCLFLAWVELFREPSDGVERGSSSAWIAGAAIGLAVLSEYPVAVPAAVLVACALRRLRFPGISRLIVAGAPFALLLAAYNKMAFGSVSALSSGHERDPAFRHLAAHGLFGVGLPSPENFVRLLFDPGRGLFVFSPILLVSLWALRDSRRQLARDAWWALVLVPLSLVLTYAGYPNWHGGWSVGSRYLVPIMPFLCAALLFRAGGVLDRLLLGASIAAVVITSLVFPFVPNAFIFPWGTFAGRLLSAGLVAPNALHLVWWPLAVVVPLVVVAVGVLAGVDRREAMAMGAGAILWLGVGFSVPAGSPALALQRAYVEEVYFERVGALEKVGPIPPSLRARKEFELRLPPPDWPFR